MRLRSLALSLVTATATLAVGWSAGRAAPPSPERPTTTATDSAAATLYEPRSEALVELGSACSAPSVVSLHGLDDARDLGALSACRHGDAWSQLVDREQAASQRCN